MPKENKKSENVKTDETPKWVSAEQAGGLPPVEKGEDKPFTVIYDEEFFNNFSTQEEVDEVVGAINEAITSGSFMVDAEPVDMDELEREEPEVAEQIKRALGRIEAKEKPTLH